MVSKAKDDLPEPERPVMTVSDPRGIETVMSLRLCSRAPETTSCSTYVKSSRANRRSPYGKRAICGLTAERGVDVLDQLAAVGELEVLGQVLLGLLAGLSVHRHVEGDQAGALRVIRPRG